MIGVLIVTHYRLAEEFLQAVQLIVGELPRFRAIGLDPATAPEDMRRRIEAELKQIDGREGVLMLVDMFGGTPSNLCLSFLDEGRVEEIGSHDMLFAKDGTYRELYDPDWAKQRDKLREQRIRRLAEVA